MKILTTDLAQTTPHIGEYALATGEAAVRRLFILHHVYSPAGRRLLLQAGIKAGMRVADLGCGVGAVTRMLAEMVGPEGSVTGIDANPAQIQQATRLCADSGVYNVSFYAADACDTKLPRRYFDLVYCRFLLLHLPDPAECLREMRALLKPNGILVVEDGDLASATSVPRTSMEYFAELFSRLGPRRGLNYSVANNLFQLVKEAGFESPQIEIHQPAGCRSDHGMLLKASVEEAGPAFVSAGLVTAPQLESIVNRMEAAANDPNVLVLAPRMSVVWARKAA